MAGAPPNHAFCAGQSGRAAEPVDAASDARSFDAATDPGDQCLAGGYGRARHDDCTRERRAQELLKSIASEQNARLPVEAHVSLVVLAAELQVMQTLINVVGTSPELWGIRRASSRVKAMAYSRPEVRSRRAARSIAGLRICLFRGRDRPEGLNDETISRLKYETIAI
jgi:hypothetical protein